MALKLNEEMVLYYIASGKLPFIEALKRIDRTDFSPSSQELYDTLLSIHQSGRKIDPAAFVEELHKRESVEAFGGPQAVLDLIAIAQSIPFEEEIISLKEQAVARRIAQLAQVDDAREAISLIRKELDKVSVAIQKRIDLKWLSEMPINFLEVDAPSKPRLMYWVEKDGAKATFLNKEIIAMLVGAGGVGKTHLLAHLAICTVTGIPFLGKFEFDAPGHVCFIAGENNEMDLHRLLRKSRVAIEDLLRENQQQRPSEQFGLHSPDPFLNATSRLMIYPVQGINARFIQPDGQPAEFFKNIKSELKAREPEAGWQLIILDPLSRFSGVDTEKDNGLATRRYSQKLWMRG